MLLHCYVGLFFHIINDMCKYLVAENCSLLMFRLLEGVTILPLEVRLYPGLKEREGERVEDGRGEGMEQREIRNEENLA